jgi:TPR repeat protein
MRTLSAAALLCLSLMMAPGTVLARAGSSATSPAPVMASPLAQRWLPAAQQGQPHGQYMVGMMSLHGVGLEQNTARGLAWLRQAAAQQHPEAQTELGVFHWQSQEPAQAATWYRRAAEQGHARAQVLLGALLDQGLGVAPDPAAAAQWYRRAADQGRADAQCLLAVLYRDGHGVPQDAAQAAAWFRQAALQGNAIAQFELGIAYVHGTGVAPNPWAAYAWMRTAATAGHTQALAQTDTLAAGLTPQERQRADALAAAWKPGLSFAD